MDLIENRTHHPLPPDGRSFIFRKIMLIKFHEISFLRLGIYIDKTTTAAFYNSKTIFNIDQV
jgi:hypothetical protein